MRILTSLLIFLSFFAQASLAQRTKADSLLAAYSEASNDIEKATLLNGIADEYRSADPNKMMDYANQALTLSRKIKFRHAEGNALLNLGNANVILGNYQAALGHFTSAAALFEKEIDATSAQSSELKNGLARAYGSIGIVFSEQSNYAKALQFHLKAATIYEKVKNPEKTARVYNNIGIVYKAQGDDFKALEYFVKSLKLQQQVGERSVGITTTNIGNIYLAQKNFPKAVEYYKQARSYFDKFPDPRGRGELHNNLGLYYIQNGKPAQALAELSKALDSFKTIGDKFGASDTYALIGEAYMLQGNSEAALANANTALALGKQLGILERIRDSEKQLSDIYSKLNRPAEALDHYKLFSIANDSINNYEHLRNSVRAEMNFDFEKKEALRKKEEEKKELVYVEQNKRHTQQLLFVILAGLLAFAIIMLFYNRRQLKKTLTLQKELAEYEQKALHLQMNPHFVFNCLGSISSFIVQNGTDSAIKYLSKFSKLMRLTLEYSKESLIPIDKEIEGLQNYLELEQLRFNQTFNFTINKSSEIEDDTALPPLLLQPFVENAIIHGLVPKKESGQINIDFTIEKSCLVCTITDNGIGFDKSQELKESLVSVHKSMALDITRKRLEMMEAVTLKSSHVDIREIKNDNGEVLGTKVVLKLPIQYIKPHPIK